MAKGRINEILDIIYEIEGLAELAYKRKETPQSIYNLLEDKASHLHNLTIEQCDICSEEEAPSATPEVDAEKGYDGSDDEAEVVEDNSELTAEDNEPIVGETEPVEDTVEPVEDTAEAIEEMGGSAVEVSEPTVETGERDKVRKLFSLNDKFRFKRELFSNRGDDFNDSLDLVAAMRNYDQAEDYFINDLQWDPENEEVVEFMSKISEYFKNK
jgi:hypothetical protein